MMVTGDYHYTAIAVARGTGMIPPGRRLVIIQSASEASAATAQPKPAQKAPKPTMTHALASSHGPHVAFADLERRLNALASLQHSSEGEEVQSHHQQPASLHMQPASELQQQQHERVRVGQLHLMLPGPKMPAWRTHEQQAQEVQAWQAGHVTQLPAQHQSAAPQQEQQHLPQLPDDNLKETVSEQGGHVHWSDDHCHLSLPIETSPAGVQKGTLHQPCDHLAEQLVFSQPSHDYHRQHIQSSLSHVYEDDLPVQLSEQADHFRGLTAGLLFLTEGYSPGQEPQTALETVAEHSPGGGPVLRHRAGLSAHAAARTVCTARERDAACCGVCTHEVPPERANHGAVEQQGLTSDGAWTRASHSRKKACLPCMLCCEACIALSACQYVPTAALLINNLLVCF